MGIHSIDCRVCLVRHDRGCLDEGMWLAQMVRGVFLPRAITLG
jgi:hypothetical protein